MVGWAGRVLFDTLVLGKMSALSICGQARKKEKNDENEPRPKTWFAFMTYKVGFPFLGSLLMFIPP